MTYDFKMLSPLDLELLVRDLLQAEWDLSLESFKTGRDQGIDLRYAAGPDSIIVQCKHYAESGYARLRAHLEKSELPKIRRLGPQRYVLATSVPLTVGQKDKLMNILSPYVLETGDILGAEQINNLIGKHEQIERRHFKLWVTSTEVLKTVLNHDVFVRSRAFTENISERVVRFVQSDAYPRALAILRDHHVVIISGPPGIGKSTLAEMLVLNYMRQGFEPVVVSEEIKEAFQIYRSADRQVFYYDDFLGQIALRPLLIKNEDDRLNNFMEMIQKASGKRLILTTREYILAQASLIYERLTRMRALSPELILSLQDYSRVARARIVYNHLYFANLDKQAIESVLEDRRYIKIINHGNYSPRIIDSVVKLATRGEIKSPQFGSFMLEVLDNPAELWDHVYVNQVTAEARCCLLALAGMPSTVSLEDVELVAEKLMMRREGRRMSRNDWRKALKTLDGTFVATVGDPNGLAIRFANPSVRDYMRRRLTVDREEFYDLLETASFVDQAMLLIDYAEEDAKEEGRGGVTGHVYKAERERLIGVLARVFGEPACQAVVVLRESGTYTYVPRRVPVDQRFNELLALANDVPRNAAVMASIQACVRTTIEQWKNLRGDAEALAAVARTLQGFGMETLAAELQPFVERWLAEEEDSSGRYAALPMLAYTWPALVNEQDMATARDAFRDWAAIELSEVVYFDDPDEIEERVTRLLLAAENLEVDIDDLVSESGYDDRIAELTREPDFDDDNEPDDGWRERVRDEGRTIEEMFESLRGDDAA